MNSAPPDVATLNPNPQTPTSAALQGAANWATTYAAAHQDEKTVIVLITDGEDLEGDPVNVARAAATDHTRVDVVQIGGRAPEPIPDVAPDGKIRGIRHDEDGKPLTTELTAEGEAQLAEIAKATGGAIVRAERGQTGIDEIARSLKKMMREDLAEHVETAFDEEYTIPLGIALALLVLEGLVPEAPLPRLPAGLLAAPARAENAGKRRRRKHA
jgi:Ca-activated chloride channel family protein